MDKKKKLRTNFRNLCLSRDNNKCRVCGKKNTELDVHHITDRNEIPNGGYVKENGISLCEECHLKAEQWHISGNTKSIEGFHPNDLYKIINSSKEKAFSSSEKLND